MSNVTTSRARYSKLLRRALFANASFSGSCAVVFLVAAGSIATLAGTEEAEVTETGIALLIFVGLLVIVATRRRLESSWVLRAATLIAAMDVLWVVLTPFKIAAYTASGKLIFGLISLAVLGLALVQIHALTGLWRGRRAAANPALEDGHQV